MEPSPVLPLAAAAPGWAGAQAPAHRKAPERGLLGSAEQEWGWAQLRVQMA